MSSVKKNYFKGESFVWFLSITHYWLYLRQFVLRRAYLLDEITLLSANL